VGELPAGFTEETPLGELSWPLDVDVWTNFRYTVDLPQEDLAGGEAVEYAPQPVFNELSPVHPARC
jgi:hypothetical protein